MLKFSPILSTNNILIKHKIIFLIILFGVSLNIAYSFYTYQNEKSNYLKSIDNQLTSGAKITKEFYGDNFHSKIFSGEVISDTDDLRNVRKLTSIAKNLNIEYLYTMFWLMIQFALQQAVQPMMN